MDLDVIWKVVSGIVGALLALLYAAWRLSRTWTRVESSVTESAAAIVRIEDTIHGGPKKENGMKEKLGKVEATVGQLDTRIEAIELRLNAGDRTGPKTTRRKPGRPGGRRKDDR